MGESATHLCVYAPCFGVRAGTRSDESCADTAPEEETGEAVGVSEDASATLTCPTNQSTAVHGQQDTTWTGRQQSTLQHRLHLICHLLHLTSSVSLEPNSHRVGSTTGCVSHGCRDTHPQHRAQDNRRVCAHAHGSCQLNIKPCILDLGLGSGPRPQIWAAPWIAAFGPACQRPLHPILLLCHVSRGIQGQHHRKLAACHLGA